MHLLRLLRLGERGPVDTGLASGGMLWLVVRGIRLRSCAGIRRLLRILGIEGLGCLGILVMGHHGALVLWRTGIGMFAGLAIHVSSANGEARTRRTGARRGGGYCEKRADIRTRETRASRAQLPRTGLIV